MWMMINRRRVMGGKSLPYDAEIEYLESTGNAYIDLGIIPIVTDYIKCEFYLVYPLSNDDASATIFGVENDWGKNSFMLVHSPGKQRCYFSRGNSSPSSTTISNNNATGSWKTLIINSNTCTCFDKSITNNSTGECLHNAFLFCGNNHGNKYGVGSTKRIRSFIWKRNNNEIMNLIPVRIDTTGYMYDKVSGQLFGNAGTGEFILGPDVN